MGSQIKRPDLRSTSPPFFEVECGHSVKVLLVDDPLWVKLLHVEGDELLGMVTTSDLECKNHDLRCRDVIEFKRCHVFGLF